MGCVSGGGATNQKAAAVPAPSTLTRQPPTARQGFSARHLMGSFTVRP